MSDSSGDEYISASGSYSYDQTSNAWPSSSFETWSRDDEDFSARSAYNSGNRFGDYPRSRAPSLADHDFDRDHQFRSTPPMNGPGRSRPSMGFPSFFEERQQARPFPPPRMALAPVQHHPNSIDWVSKLNLWDQAQKTRTESKYEFRQLDNGDHIAQVNVAGSGRIFQGIAKKKMQAKQEAAKGACDALRLRVG